MKRFYFWTFLLLGLLPQAKAQYNQQIHQLCESAADYLGCIKAYRDIRPRKSINLFKNETNATCDYELNNCTVTVGILHSLTGTMAISESTLVDTEKMAIDEINAAGGVEVDGKKYKIEYIVEDGASDWPTFAEKSKKLIDQDAVPVVFGGWTSASRKACLLYTSPSPRDGLLSRMPSSA